MAGNFFRRIFKLSPSDKFETVTAVDEFIKEKTGKELKIKHVHSRLCSSRGSVFQVIKTKNPGKIFKKSLASLAYQPGHAFKRCQHHAHTI